MLYVQPSILLSLLIIGMKITFSIYVNVKLITKSSHDPF